MSTIKIPDIRDGSQSAGNDLEYLESQRSYSETSGQVSQC